ncbi:MAG: dienelactone hydrolase family protein [Bacteroidota bacterium]
MYKELLLPVDKVSLRGSLRVPDEVKGFVIFSHGSGSSRKSPRNRFVAETLEANGFATLLFDLLTEEEDREYARRFNINVLSHRLITATKWLRSQPEYAQWKMGYFGASTGAASALIAASTLGPEVIKAVVSRGGRPDMATTALPNVKSPTLLLVGGLDTKVIKLNQQAYDELKCKKELAIIPGASHLFEEPGTLEQVTRLANNWFLKYLYQFEKDIEKDFF